LEGERMALVHFLLADGSERSVTVDAGMSVMTGAIRNNVPGIEAECGGNADCATCHVHVDAAHLKMLPEASEHELALLEGVAAPRDITSRLSCQIIVTAEMDELIVRVPETQL
jgi:2Fe-2S ferredoxin